MPALILAGDLSKYRTFRLGWDLPAVAKQGIQGKAARTNTEAGIAILEEKRAEAMSREEAGYFIHDWQEIGDQVAR